MTKRFFLVIAGAVLIITTVFSQKLTQEQLTKGRWLSQKEYDSRGDIGKYFQPTDAPEGPVHPVAEFEIMQGVLIAYPFGIPMDLIVEMAEDVVVTTIVSSSSQANSVSAQYENAGANMDHIEFLIEPHDTYWTRDYGPWFIREEDQISIVNFTYNRPRPDDDVMPINIANDLGINYYNMPVVHTGGNFMCDGFGVAAQTELVYQENSISNDQVDQYMEDYLGVTDNYVVNDPLDDYIMHIDCWGKFLDYDKVLVVSVPESDYRYEDYEAAANYFATRNCAYGYPWEVIRIYGPGDYPYTPYSNSLILNKKVFLPITGSQYDDDAIATYEEAMPGYEIIPIMAGSNGWLNTDALHCRTHEIADIGMLKITHIPPFHGEVEYTGEQYFIEAEIHAYSNEALYPDSLLLYYKINEGDYSSVLMTQTEGENYGAFIDATAGDEVSYYIHAADESGRSEDSPYIGAADPFTFIIEDGNFLALTPDTLNIGNDEGQKITVTNMGNSDIDIQNIIEQDNHSDIWWIDYTVPEISEYPYTLAAGESIDVFIDYIIFKNIFYDSLLVITQDSTYHSIITMENVSAGELTNETSELSFYPNPLTDRGEVSFTLQEPAAVELDIYNVQGQLIETLEASRLTSGSYTYTWSGETFDGKDAEKGIYLVYLQIDDRVVTKKWVKM